MPGAPEDLDPGSAIRRVLAEEANSAVNTDSATTKIASATSSSAKREWDNSEFERQHREAYRQRQHNLGSTSACRAEGSDRQTLEEQLLGATRMYPSRVAAVAIQVAAAAVVVPVAVGAAVEMHFAETLETGAGEDGCAAGLGGGGRLMMVTTLVTTSHARRTPTHALRKKFPPRSCTTSTETPTTSSISTSTAAPAGPGVTEA